MKVAGCWCDQILFTIDVSQVLMEAMYCSMTCSIAIFSSSIEGAGRFISHPESRMEEARAKGLGGETLRYIHWFDFIKRMDLAYAAADAVVSRSGASSVSELAAEHKAVIFVPSPNVAENHQTHNAMALVRKNAAMIVPDAEAPQRLMEEACGLLGDKEKIAGFEKIIATFARPDAAKKIVEEIYRLV